MFFIFATAVERVKALFDRTLSLRCTAEAIECGDQAGRRDVVKRAGNFINLLQRSLRIDLSRTPVQALSEFYATIFAQILQASQSASLEKFDHAIDCVRNVRDAWREVARDPEVNPAPLQVSRGGRGQAEFGEDAYGADAAVGSSWNA